MVLATWPHAASVIAVMNFVRAALAARPLDKTKGRGSVANPGQDDGD
jgi:hypothetical protein